MSIGHSRVEPIMPRLRDHIKDGSEHYNIIYEAIQFQIEEREKLEAENKGLKEKYQQNVGHIKDVLSAAIARPNEIALGWEEFLLKFVERALKEVSK